MQLTSTEEDFKRRIHSLIADSKKKAKAASEAAAVSPGTAADGKENEEGQKKGKKKRAEDAVIPYQIISCLSSFDNIYETRLFGWVLAKAQSVIKMYNKDLRFINMQHALNLARVTMPARLLLAPGDKNYSNIGRAFTLANKKIEYEREGHHYHLNIIAFPETFKDDRGNLMLTFVIHNELWHTLLDFSKGYRLFRLETFVELTSKYSIIMYLLVTQQEGVKRYGTMQLRQLLGCDQLKAYDRGANLFARCLDPARNELKQKAPYYFDYSANKTGSAKKITDIIITPRPNPSFIVHERPASVTEETAARLRLRLEEEVIKYLGENFDCDSKTAERMEQHLFKLGDSYEQLRHLGKIKETMLRSRVRNKVAYLVVSLRGMIK